MIMNSSFISKFVACVISVSDKDKKKAFQKILVLIQLYGRLRDHILFAKVKKYERHAT